jgi:hypothetical protein
MASPGTSLSIGGAYSSAPASDSFGVMNGVADDIVIQRAINAVSGLNDGGELHIAAGVYNLAAGLTITANKRLRIVAYGCTFRVPAGVAGLLISQGNVNARGVVVEGAKFDGQGLSGNAGIVAQDTNNVTLIEPTVEGCIDGIILRSNAANGFVEGTRIENPLLRDNGTGIAFRTVAGTGSFAQTMIHGLRCVVGSNGIGLDLDSPGILQRGWIQGTFWIDSNETAVSLDGNIEDSTLRLAVEGAGGSTGNVALDIGTNLVNMDQAEISLLLTGVINTQLNNPGGKAFHYYPNAGKELIVQTAGTTFIGYRRHGDSTDRIRWEALTAGGKMTFGNGTLLDVELHRSAADILASADQWQPASFKEQTKAGTPVDGDIVGGAVDGNIVVDTTASKIWVRVGGVWKGVVVA